MRIFHSPTYDVGNFDTTAKAARIVADLTERPVPGVEIVDPGLFDERFLPHHPAYVEAVMTGKPRGLAESAGVDAWSPALRDSVLASTAGCARAAAVALNDGVAGSLSSGLHHARYSRGEGFCTFNGIAVAVRQFQRLGATRVLVVDLDAHCGGGTFDILGADANVGCVDLSTEPYDNYRADDPSWSLVVERRAADYCTTLDLMVHDVLDAFGEPDAVVYNAGMDCHEDCGVGGLDGLDDATLAAREAYVAETFAGAPLAWVLAGGYTGKTMTPQHLTALHRFTIEEFA